MDAKSEMIEILRSIAMSLESIAASLDDIADASAHMAADAHQRDDDPDQPPTTYLSGKRVT